VLRSFFALVGFDGILGCFRTSTDLHGCTRILLGGFWGWDWLAANLRELFRG
jgi:hypothetical protein